MSKPTLASLDKKGGQGGNTTGRAVERDYPENKEVRNRFNWFGGCNYFNARWRFNQNVIWTQYLALRWQQALLRD